MEALSSAARRRLKQAHPGLTDADIDRSEALASESFALDPTTEADAIRSVEAERVALLRARMPHYASVVRESLELEGRAGRRVKVPPRVTVRSVIGLEEAAPAAGRSPGAPRAQALGDGSGCGGR